jgi:hypothetical protein
VFCILVFNSVSYVFLLLCSCTLIVTYALFCFRRANWQSSATLTEVFPFFCLSCKADARVQFGARPALFPVSYLCRSVYSLCVNVNCTTATGCQPNCSWQVYHIIYYIVILYIISHHITPHHITSHHTISHHITPYHITPHHASHHTTSHNITSYNTISHHIT